MGVWDRKWDGRWGGSVWERVSWVGSMGMSVWLNVYVWYCCSGGARVVRLFGSSLPQCAYTDTQ